MRMSELADSAPMYRHKNARAHAPASPSWAENPHSTASIWSRSGPRLSSRLFRWPASAASGPPHRAEWWEATVQTPYGSAVEFSDAPAPHKTENTANRTD